MIQADDAMQQAGRLSIEWGGGIAFPKAPQGEGAGKFTIAQATLVRSTHA